MTLHVHANTLVSRRTVGTYVDLGKWPAIGGQGAS